jgi:hypothetical protein
MNLPFTVEQFLQVFASYNNAIWPLQVVLNLLAFSAIVLAIRRRSFSNRAIVLLLGALWLWMGIVYHIGFFATINPAAYGFGALFIIQGILFLWLAARNSIQFRPSLGLRQSIGSLFLLYGLLIYPLLGYAFGHGYPHAPTFGAPCPTTIFTFGILLWAMRVPRYALIIPLLWSAIGFTAALTLGIREDIGLLVAGLVGTVLLFMVKPLSGSMHAGSAG